MIGDRGASREGGEVGRWGRRGAKKRMRERARLKRVRTSMRLCWMGDRCRMHPPEGTINLIDWCQLGAFAAPPASRED